SRSSRSGSDRRSPLGIPVQYNLIQPVGVVLSHPACFDQTLHGVIEGVIAKPPLASLPLGDLEPLAPAGPALRAVEEAEQGSKCQVVENDLFGGFLGVLFSLFSFYYWLIGNRHFLADDEIEFLALGSDDLHLLQADRYRGRFLNVARAYAGECGLLGGGLV